jgi:hypothetical protein
MQSNVLWKGKSPLTGDNIVALVAWDSSNAKTGNMAQVYILVEDMHPVEAVKAGEDLAVCGYCPMRGDKTGENRSCYVVLGHGPSQVYKKYLKQEKQVSPEEFKGHKIRWGAYGDPAFLPEQLVKECNKHSRGWTGYTHQYKYPFAKWTKGVFMASVETEKQEKALLREGWGTFRAGLMDGSDKGSALLCLNESKGVTCQECGICDGRKKAIFIPSHGIRAKNVPAERLLKKKRVEAAYV